MKSVVRLLLLLSFVIPPAGAAGGDVGNPSTLEPPSLSEPVVMEPSFDTRHSFTSSTRGIFLVSPDITLAPELGIGYRGADQELHGGIEQSTHRLHAQAGWRLSLSKAFYLSGAAKFSMLTVETRGITAGEELGTRPEYGFRNVYEFNPTHTPRWTGELGLHLTPRTDLMLYYDQDPVTGWSYSGQHQEERLGTRFIFRFK